MIERRHAIGARDRLQIVQDNDEFLPEARQTHWQARRPSPRSTLRALEPLERSAPKTGPNPIDRSGDVCPESHGIIVAGIESDPGDRRRPACTPGAHRRCLSVARRCRDEHRRARIAGVQRAANARPIDQCPPRERRRELCLRQRLAAGRVESDTRLGARRARLDAAHPGIVTAVAHRRSAHALGSPYHTSCRRVTTRVQTGAPRSVGRRVPTGRLGRRRELHIRCERVVGRTPASSRCRRAT